MNICMYLFCLFSNVTNYVKCYNLNSSFNAFILLLQRVFIFYLMYANKYIFLLFVKFKGKD